MNVFTKLMLCEWLKCWGKLLTNTFTSGCQFKIFRMSERICKGYSFEICCIILYSTHNSTSAITIVWCAHEIVQLMLLIQLLSFINYLLTLIVARLTCKNNFWFRCFLIVVRNSLLNYLRNNWQQMNGCYINFVMFCIVI